MTRGLVQSEISYIETSKKLVNSLYSSPTIDDNAKKTVINQDSWSNASIKIIFFFIFIF